MDGKVLPGTVFPVRCVIGSEGSFFGYTIGRLRRIGYFRRHGRGIDGFTLSDGAAGQTGAEQKRQNKYSQLLRCVFGGQLNLLKTLTKDIHHARGVTHDHDAGNQQCQKAASTENNAGRGQAGGGKVVLKTVPKSFLVTFHVEGRLMQIGQRFFGEKDGGSFHDRASAPEVLASVSTLLTESTRTTACG